MSGLDASVFHGEGARGNRKCVRGPLAVVKRTFDILLSAGLLVVLSPLLAVVALTIRLTSKGPTLYWSKRIGKDNTIFLMPKFRSMHVNTPQLATHLMTDPARHLTPIGGFLRRTSLDELPQLWSILVGNMSFVGPRPALYNQDDLVALRTSCGVHALTPGLTGWAQVNGRDELPIPEKVALDRSYLENRSIFLDLRILARTLAKVLRRENVSH
jgi:O-antigen biosynthesis protein WbqP